VHTVQHDGLLSLDTMRWHSISTLAHTRHVIPLQFGAHASWISACWLASVPVVSRSVTLRLKSLNHCVSFTSFGALSITPSCASLSVSTRLEAESAARRTAPSAVLDTLADAANRKGTGQ
jgi:hypothetical protein